MITLDMAKRNHKISDGPATCFVSVTGDFRGQGADALEKGDIW